MTSTNKIAIQNALEPIYPKEPKYCRQCPINEIYQSLPPTNPCQPIEWERVAAGPTSMKHIYTGLPNFYPYQTLSRPKNTLYGHDFSQYHRTGVGKGKRISYGYKPYPLTDRNVRETRLYANYLLPYTDTRNWTRHPVQTDTTVNSPLQEEPYAYYSEW